MVFSRSSLAAWSETPALSRSASSRLSPVHCNATKQQQQQQRQKPVVQAPSQTTALDNRQVISVEKIANTPILSAGGGGIFFWWEIGAVEYLQQRYALSKWQMRGASAGALVATLAACNVNIDTAFECAHRLSVENKLFERPLGLAGVWGNIVRQWLDEILPENAAEMCRDRLKLIVTDIGSRQLAYLDDFKTKEELIDANMASAHIPFFLDWKPFAMYRGRRYIDGSVTDFLYYDNSPLLKCGGQAFILDYSQDEMLKSERLDFVKLRDPEEIKHLISTGYAYAQRLDEQGVFAQYFGGTRGLQSPNTALAS